MLSPYQRDLRPNRSAPRAPSKTIVDAEAQDVRLKPGVPEQHVTLVGEVDEQIFGFRRPVRREADLKAAAAGPADMQVRFTRGAGLDASAAIGEAEGCVEHDVVHRVADTAAPRPVPAVGELP